MQVKIIRRPGLMLGRELLNEENKTVVLAEGALVTVDRDLGKRLVDAGIGQEVAGDSPDEHREEPRRMGRAKYTGPTMTTDAPKPDLKTPDLKTED